MLIGALEDADHHSYRRRSRGALVVVVGTLGTVRQRGAAGDAAVG